MGKPISVLEWLLIVVKLPRLHEYTIRNPGVVLSKWKDQKFRYITDELYIVVNKEGEVVTGCFKNEFV